MGEYIKRDTAIRAVMAAKWVDGSDGAMAMEIVASPPAADVIPRPRWIPADEELPPEGKHVLCWYEYFRYGGYNRMYQTFGIGYRFCEYWGGEVAQGRDAKVLAWMPLPEPPEMDGGADNG